MTTSNASASNFIGIDLGGATLKGALISNTGEIIRETRFETEPDTPTALFSQIVEAAETLREGDKPGGPAAAIGIGIPGLVNRKTNRIEIMPNLPGLSQIDITSEL